MHCDVSKHNLSANDVIPNNIAACTIGLIGKEKQRVDYTKDSFLHTM